MSLRLVGGSQWRWWYPGLWLAIGIVAQPLHLPALQIPPSPSSTSNVEIDISGSAASGTSSYTIVDGRISLERLDPVYEVVASVHGRYGGANDEVIAKEWGTAISVDATPEEDFSFFAFADFEQNPIRKLTRRVRMGSGAKWVLMRSLDEENAPSLDEDELSVSVALLAASEKHETEDATTWRWSFRLKKDLDITNRTVLGTTWFLQPQLDAMHDYLVDGFVRVSQQITERLELTFTFDYFRDSDPPTDVKHSEKRYLFGVTGRL